MWKTSLAPWQLQVIVRSKKDNCVTWNASGSLPPGCFIVGFWYIVMCQMKDERGRLAFIGITQGARLDCGNLGEMSIYIDEYSGQDQFSCACNPTHHRLAATLWANQQFILSTAWTVRYPVMSPSLMMNAQYSFWTCTTYGKPSNHSLSPVSWYSLRR